MKRYTDLSVVPMFLRPLLAITDVFRYVLLRTGVDSRIVTFGWFLVGLCAHGVTAFGASWSFVVGALLVYVKISLDIVDGEIGRYQKRFMCEEEDLASHMKGIYLDRVQHFIESPLWGLALGLGAYRLTGSLWMLPCGLAVAIFRAFWRFDGMLQQHVAGRFSERMAATPLNKSIAKNTRRKGDTRVCFRVFGKVEFWLRNGKRFNLLVLVCGLADWILGSASVKCVEVFLWGVGPICLCSIVFHVVALQFGDRLVLLAKKIATMPQRQGE